MMGLPELTPQERASAAARGVAARQLRASVRSGLASGQIHIRQVLLDGQAGDDRGRTLARMRVVDLLSSYPGIGPVRAEDLMQRIGIAPNRRIGGLGVRQAEAIVAAIEDRYPDGRPPRRVAEPQ